MNIHSIDNESILYKDADSVKIKFIIPKECDFFDGHFPEFKLLPAVAQIQVVTRYARQYFDIPAAVKKARRMKFVMPVLPDAEVILKLDINREKKSVSFTMSKAADESAVYATGAYNY